MCCFCGGGTDYVEGIEDCEDTHGDFVDSYGDGCDWYDYAPEDCGHYDTDDFHSNEMCCGCIRMDYYEDLLEDELGEFFED